MISLIELARETPHWVIIKHSNAPEFSAMSSHDFIPARVVDYRTEKRTITSLTMKVKLGIHPAWEQSMEMVGLKVRKQF